MKCESGNMKTLLPKIFERVHGLIFLQGLYSTKNKFPTFWSWNPRIFTYYIYFKSDQKIGLKQIFMKATLNINISEILYKA